MQTMKMGCIPCFLLDFPMGICYNSKDCEDGEVFDFKEEIKEL